MVNLVSMILPHLRPLYNVDTSLSSAEKVGHFSPPRPASPCGTFIVQDLLDIKLAFAADNVNILETVDLRFLPEFEKQVEDNHHRCSEVALEKVLGSFGTTHFAVADRGKSGPELGN